MLEQHPRDSVQRYEDGFPATEAARRHNRRMLALVVVPTMLLGAAAVAYNTMSSTSRSVAPVNVPAGFKAVSDGQFGYAIPKGWSTNGAVTDAEGDFGSGQGDSWADEHLQSAATAPGPDAAPPAAFRSFGMSVPSDYSLGKASAVAVPGAQVAYRYRLTRPGGFSAVAVDAWRSSDGSQLWLLVHADAKVTEQIIGSLSAG